MMDTKFVVVYGVTDFPYDLDDNQEGGLKTLFFSTMEEVKSVARKFITVIPDDLVYYENQISQWDGNQQLYITHQDDDTFYFTATPIQQANDYSQFASFVNQYQVEG